MKTKLALILAIFLIISSCQKKPSPKDTLTPSMNTPAENSDETDSANTAPQEATGRGC